MTQLKKETRGRKPSKNPAKKSLGMVRVTETQIDDYKSAAEHSDKSLSGWIKDTLDKASQRINNK